MELVSSLRLQRDEAVVEAARWKARAEEAAAAVKHMETNVESQMEEWRVHADAELRATQAAAVSTPEAAGGESVTPAGPPAHARSTSLGPPMRWSSGGRPLDSSRQLSASQPMICGGGLGLGALEAAAEEEATTRVLIDTLPRVALHVLIQHRVELLPLFQRAIARCNINPES